MIVKIGEVSHSKEEWLNGKEADLDNLQGHVVEIIQKWTDNEALFYLTTSGSTGAPKRIALSRELLVWSANNTFNYLGLSKEKIGCCLPLNKAGGFMMLIRSLIYDCDIHIVEPVADPIPSLDLDCSFVSLVPYQLIQIFRSEASKAKLNRMNKILLGGAEIPSGLLPFLNELTSDVYYGYGMTETASHIALAAMNKGDFKSGFDILPGVEINTLEFGMIAISIPAFDLNLTTNDIGKIVNNKLIVIGRQEQYMNSGGLKIHASELEEVISRVLIAHQLDISFVVFGLSHPTLGEAISLIAEEIKIPIEIQSIINLAIEQNMGSKCKIINWKKIDQFPRVNQKIDRRQLKTMVQEIQPQP